MAGPVPAIHVFAAAKKGVDTRDQRGHDESSIRDHLIAQQKSPPNWRAFLDATHATQRYAPHTSGTP
jgi:hypothetical protein